MNELRAIVAAQMVVAHCIARDLADYHAASMDEEELKDRFRRYAGMELSVAGRNTQSGSDFYPVFGSATATARRAALSPVPDLPIEHESRKESARAGSKKPGPMVGRALSASH